MTHRQSMLSKALLLLPMIAPHDTSITFFSHDTWPSFPSPRFTTYDQGHMTNKQTYSDFIDLDFSQLKHVNLVSQQDRTWGKEMQKAHTE